MLAGPEGLWQETSLRNEGEEELHCLLSRRAGKQLRLVSVNSVHSNGEKRAAKEKCPSCALSKGSERGGHVLDFSDVQEAGLP